MTTTIATSVTSNNNQPIPPQVPPPPNPNNNNNNPTPVLPQFVAQVLKQEDQQQFYLDALVQAHQTQLALQQHQQQHQLSKTTVEEEDQDHGFSAVNSALLQDCEDKTRQTFEKKSLHAKVLFKYVRQRGAMLEDTTSSLSTRFFDPVHKFKIVKGNNYVVRVCFDASAAANWSNINVLPPVLLDNMFRPANEIKPSKKAAKAGKAPRTSEPCVEIVNHAQKKSSSSLYNNNNNNNNSFATIASKEGFVIIEYTVKFNVLSSRQGQVALACPISLNNNTVFLTATSSQFEIVSRRNPQPKKNESKAEDDNNASEMPTPAATASNKPDSRKRSRKQKVAEVPVVAEASQPPPTSEFCSSSPYDELNDIVAAIASSPEQLPSPGTIGSGHSSDEGEFVVGDFLFDDLPMLDSQVAAKRQRMMTMAENSATSTSSPHVLADFMSFEDLDHVFNNDEGFSGTAFDL